MEASEPSASSSVPGSSHEDLSSTLDALVPPPSPDSRTALIRLASHPRFGGKAIDFPPRKLAAVLVLLHVCSDGGLQVTLTTRSMKLRSHPGDTALPGGRVDVSDESIEAAALREANEEIALPLPSSAPSPSYLHLTTLRPLISRYHLIVVPVVYLILAPSNPSSALLPTFAPNPAEVSAIFSWPLAAFVDASLSPAPATSLPTGETRQGEYTYGDFILASELNSSPYRWHSLAHPAMPSPITGLTFDVLLATVRVAYPAALEARFVGEAEGQASWEELVRLAAEAGRKDAERKKGSIMTPVEPQQASA